jgi:hypothetical protein
MSSTYTIRRVNAPLDVSTPWDAPGRAAAETLDVAHFWPQASDHRPHTQFRLLWDDAALHGMFRVEDHYVRAAQMAFNGSVCKDSCVEFFVQPADGSGYCNFEFNCCGVLLASHIEDEKRHPGGFAKWRPWTEAEGGQVGIAASLAGPIPEERVGACVWTVAFRIPFAPLRACTGAPYPEPGTSWRANVYKCGDHTSHPHWGAWRPVDVLNFHLPRCFGEMRFA